MKVFYDVWGFRVLQQLQAYMIPGKHGYLSLFLSLSLSLLFVCLFVLEGGFVDYLRSSVTQVRKAYKFFFYFFLFFLLPNK
jgi:hypothetical protein